MDGVRSTLGNEYLEGSPLWSGGTWTTLEGTLVFYKSVHNNYFNWGGGGGAILEQSH